jgi:YVTN family beta-propeller protein
VVDPIDGRFLYVSLNASGVVEKINRATGQIMGRVHTGSGCRTLAISTDGTALFVVNYDSNSMTMLRAGDLHVIQTVRTGTHPVGVTYDGKTGRVWVAVYTGAIMIFNTK